MEGFESFLSQLNLCVSKDQRFLAICVAGSSITDELDAFSDLDIVLVTENGVSFEAKEMVQFAQTIHPLLVGFTGEHVGERRLLICLYENPLIHVDLKFVEIKDLTDRVENPKIIFDRYNQISEIFSKSIAVWPKPEIQWLEDRFWVWIHYLASKIGRGEFFEAIDSLSFIRSQVVGPLFHLKYKLNPRGVRKLEFILSPVELEKLKKTSPSYDFNSLVQAALASIELYLTLREPYLPNLILRKKAQKESIEYLKSLSPPSSLL